MSLVFFQYAVKDLGRADEPARRLRDDIDVPDVAGAATVDEGGHSVDRVAHSGGADMIDTHLLAHGMLVVSDIGERPHTGDGLSQRHGGTAVENAERLTRTLIDRHGCLGSRCTYICILYAQTLHKTSAAGAIEGFEVHI